MSINNANANNIAYGLNNPLQKLSPQPIIAKRDPKVSDFAAVGTLWCNIVNATYFVLVSVTGGSSTWAAQATGSGSFPSVEITAGTGTVLTVDAGGDTLLGGDLDVTGDTTLDGNASVGEALTVTGIATISGVQFLSGSGSPDSVVTAPQGSFYLNTAGSGVADRAFINTDGADSWTAVTTAS